MAAFDQAFRIVIGGGGRAHHQSGRSRQLDRRRLRARCLPGNALWHFGGGLSGAGDRDADARRCTGGLPTGLLGSGAGRQPVAAIGAAGVRCRGEQRREPRHLLVAGGGGRRAGWGVGAAHIGRSRREGRAGDRIAGGVSGAALDVHGGIADLAQFWAWLGPAFMPVAL